MGKEEQACLGLAIGGMASNHIFREQKSIPSIESKIDARLAAMDLDNCDVEKANMVYDYIMQDQKEELPAVYDECTYLKEIIDRIENKQGNK